MNIFDYAVPEKNEAFSTLLIHKNIEIKRIVSADTVETKSYTQKEDEWVVVLKGQAVLLLKDKECRLSKGDTLFIPAKTPHKVLQTQKGTLWLTVHIY